MRKPFYILMILLFSLPALCAVPVTGNLKDIATGAVSSGTFVRFELQNCGGFTPRVTGTSLIVRNSYDFRPNTSGAISGNLYGNDEIECGGNTDSTWYNLSVYYNSARQGLPIPVKVYAPGFNVTSYSACTTCGKTPTPPPATAQGYIYQTPVGDQTVNQPAGTNFLLSHDPTVAMGAATRNYVDTRLPVVVDGTTYPRTDAGIQAAINAAPAGGTVILPVATYTACDNLPITINKSIHLEGYGDGSLLQVCPTLDAAKDVILIKPASAFLFNVKLRNLFINPSSGTPGRYAIYFDGTTGTADQATLEHLRIGETGSWAIYADGTGGGNGIPRITRIQDSIITGGIKFLKAGDTLNIEHNMIDGPRAALDVDFQPGASTLIFARNNVPAKGGLHIGGSAVATHIFENEFETVSGFTGSNGAFLDIDGTVGAPADGVIVRDNSFQIVNSITADGVRVNYADGTLIEGNRFYRGATTSKDITISANADNTHVGKNRWVSGAPIASMVADSGTGTSYGFLISDEYVLKNNTSFTQLDEGGTQRSIFRTTNDGTVYWYGYHGTPLFRSSDGASYLYDGAGNIAAAFNATEFSTDVVASTYSTFAHLKATQDLILGNSSTALSRYAKYTASLSPSAVAANTCAAQSVTITGVLAADVIIGFQKPTEQAGLSLTGARATADNTVSLQFCNNTAAPITPTAAETYTFVVVQ